MTLGMFIMPVMDAIAKYLGGTMSPIQISCGRFLFQTLIMATALLITTEPKALIPKMPIPTVVEWMWLATMGNQTDNDVNAYFPFVCVSQPPYLLDQVQHHPSRLAHAPFCYF